MEKPYNPHIVGTENTTNPSQKSPLFFIIVAFLLIITTGVIGYFLGKQSQKIPLLQEDSLPVISVQNDYSPDVQQGQSNEITDWQSFSSKTNGVRFKYPHNYQLPEDRENYISLLSPLSTTPNKSFIVEEDELKMEIVIFEATPNDTVEAWSKEYLTQTNINEKVTEDGTTTIGTKPAIILRSEGMGIAKLYLLIHNGKRILIVKYPYVSERDDEFEQILSTIQFEG